MGPPIPSGFVWDGWALSRILAITVGMYVFVRGLPRTGSDEAQRGSPKALAVGILAAVALGAFLLVIPTRALDEPELGRIEPLMFVVFFCGRSLLRDWRRDMMLPSGARTAVWALEGLGLAFLVTFALSSLRPYPARGVLFAGLAAWFGAEFIVRTHRRIRGTRLVTRLPRRHPRIGVPA
jgi:hypothetical protein